MAIGLSERICARLPGRDGTHPIPDSAGVGARGGPIAERRFEYRDPWWHRRVVLTLRLTTRGRQARQADDGLGPWVEWRVGTLVVAHRLLFHP